ncbi:MULTISPECIES: hypothetical protein [unclassified Mesorhizobium]|uniref:hypothetical protein n=1 Tax=unclassified Mesorhizobium TaxID=325217 RepID=UPI00333E0473
MDDDKSDHDRLKSLVAKSVAKETGITEAQALDLINMIGTDRPSLLREARMLKARQRPAEESQSPR